MSVAHPIAAPPRRVATALRVLIVCLVSVAYLPFGAVDRASAAAVNHLVVSEVMTGGTSASDELIELYNPSSAPLPLEGLELIYVTASGATVSRRAAWSLGAPEMPPGGHLLVANELGIFAPIADALYASGMAATGGSVALRIQGATTAIDAVGWGTAASTWLEGLPATAPPAGASLERLPGGTAGSTVDTDDNAADFTVRAVPDPQNGGSPPVPDPTLPSPTPTEVPSATPTPTSTASATPAPTGTPGPTATSSPTPITIAAARGMADGTTVTVEGDALTASDFADGGGYLADASGGIAVLLDGGSFARGDHLVLTGVLDDRFAQRTIRAAGEEVTVTGTGAAPDPVASTTGSINESVEAHLVRIQGTIGGSPTALSGGLAFEVDDGSGAVRVVVGTATGIDTIGWSDGVGVSVIGVVGQRDSSGTGAAGYRVQPRGADDVELLPATSPTPSPGGSPGPEPTATASPSGSVVPIADARAAAKQARVIVRGVVTLASGTVDAGSAIIQDGSGAILLRLGDEAGEVSLGELLEVSGVRSTKSGMESLRVSVGPRRIGTAPDPIARSLRSGEAGESVEAQLVVVRGAVVASARTVSSGTVSFEIDDGSGPLRIVLGASLAADGDPFTAGTWVEVRGVLGQETTGAQPLRGYRVWPRDAGDVRVLAAATDTSAAGGSSGLGDGTVGGGSVATVSLASLGASGLADLRVGATLVAPAWPELGVAGLLWDGTRLVGIAPASAPHLEEVTEGRAMPIPLELVGLRAFREDARAGLGLVTLGVGPGDTVVGSAPPAPPSPIMPAHTDPPRWVSLVGRVTNDERRQVIEVDGARIVIQRLCSRGGRLPEGTANLVGMATAAPPRIVVACDGARPAPALALAANADGGTVRPASGAGALLDPDADATTGRRLLAAALLAIGVAILVVAVVIGRRLEEDVPDVATDEGLSVEEAAPSAARLTLVRLPNEHGP